MEFEIDPKVPQYPCLGVHITLQQPYELVRDAFDRAISNLEFVTVETTKGGPKHRFDVRERGSLEPLTSVFRTAVTFFDIPGMGTRVVIENRKSDDVCANGLRGVVGTVVGAFCKVCVAQGIDMTGADMARLLLELEPHLTV